MELNKLEYGSDYEVEILTNSTDKAPDYVFYTSKTKSKPGELSLETSSTSLDILRLKITPFGKDYWIGKFEAGVEGVSGLYATPSESNLCVVFKGQGYWVPVNCPHDYQIIPSYPIKKILAVPGMQIMIFVDYDRLVAYSASGLIWKTPGLSWDGLKILEINEDTIKGTGWDAPNNQLVEFCVAVKNGSHIGGSSPDMYGSSGTADRQTT